MNLIYIVLFLAFDFFLYISYKKFIKKEKINLKNSDELKFQIKRFFIQLIKITWILIWLILSFWIYQNYLNPTEMIQYTMTNGDKTLKFQSMAHIASNHFYDSVKKDIKENKNDWYVLYFEWVRPWTEENQEKFNNLMWIQFSKETYEQLKILYWLTNQVNSEFLNIVNDKDYNIDVDFDTIIKDYEKKYWPVIIDENKKPIEISWTVEQMTKELSYMLPAIQFYNKALINFTTKHQGLRKKLVEMMNKKDFFDIIIVNRSDYLAEEVMKKTDKEIFVIYWMEHFDSFYKKLKELDPKWEITWQKEIQLIK